MQKNPPYSITSLSKVWGPSLYRMDPVLVGNLGFGALAPECLANQIELECCTETLSLSHNITFVYYGKIPILILQSG